MIVSASRSSLYGLALAHLAQWAFRMRTLLLVGLSLVVMAYISACGQCAAICFHSATINAVDSAGNPLAIQTIAENTGLSPSTGCGVTPTPNSSPPGVTSSCPRFGLDVVGTDGKRFSGVIDLADGIDTAPICGSVCKSKSVTVTLQ